MKRIHEFRDRTFVEKSIDMITTRLVERKSIILLLLKERQQKSTQRLYMPKRMPSLLS